MNIIKIITAALITLLFPNEEAMRNARTGIMIDIQQKYEEKECGTIKSQLKLSDISSCSVLNFMLQRKTTYVQTGMLYKITENMVHHIETYNNNPDNTEDFPYGDCHHHLILQALDKDEPLAIYKLLITQCTDPATKKDLNINLAENNRRYLKNE